MAGVGAEHSETAAAVVETTTAAAASAGLAAAVRAAAAPEAIGKITKAQLKSREKTAR